MPVGGRVAGKIGIISSLQNGAVQKDFGSVPSVDGTKNKSRNHTGINEEIIWVSIGMGITIAILITIALCYIMREKCKKRHEYYITA
ncbi:uncharacterized protein [Periplaneta americana]|uniref:uncharacterized protein n=1 Tax=Periplaneta americana TaxID=6978 RepID=UPI0037E7DDAC